jgi:hypothetical protein
VKKYIKIIEKHVILKLTADTAASPEEISGEI